MSLLAAISISAAKPACRLIQVAPSSPEKKTPSFVAAIIFPEEVIEIFWTVLKLLLLVS